ncbi:hypothetical protein HJG60_010127 [Phyllostomus discolor]|uniref:Gelsolin-like domain-containing protein n=1 Tax=Phyllostomus discolor TaxID=89673 RepID=A0A834EMJ3_9CHIR|nr:hypothetical protein HJG60_010127 [Phyllostomus discolor]
MDHIAVVDRENEKESLKLMEVMNRVLGKKRELKAAVPDTVVEFKATLKATLKWYHVSDAEGKLVAREVTRQPLTEDLLNHEDCYIRDQGGLKICAWKGKNDNAREWKGALSQALNFIKAK